ncbi:MAG: hypothetical protein GY696_20620 [Gammaproteobacteria bacterium]|nr:hypothetical protein [Gammaproteobacteria bacterium]
MAAIPKKGSEKSRLIHNLSVPTGRSVNDCISPEDAKTQYSHFDSAVDLVRKCGKNAWLSKADLKSAYKHLVVKPEQWHLLGLHLDGSKGKEYYFDATLPFGLRTSCAIFNKLADALAFCARQRGVEHEVHYLDDSLVVEPCGCPKPWCIAGHLRDGL